MKQFLLQYVCVPWMFMQCCMAVSADEQYEFVEKRIRPLLIEHCYSCHGGQSQELKGELRLDLCAGWQLARKPGRLD